MTRYRLEKIGGGEQRVGTGSIIDNEEADDIKFYLFENESL